MRALAGTSLKEQSDLWEAFSNFRKARNTYVHEGRLEVAGSLIDLPQATSLVDSAAP